MAQRRPRLYGRSMGRRPETAGSHGGRIPDPITLEVARRVRVARDAAGLSLAEASAAMGITKAYLWRLEDSRQVPTVVALAKVARGLGTTVSDLLAGITADVAPSNDRDTGTTAGS